MEELSLSLDALLVFFHRLVCEISQKLLSETLLLDQNEYLDLTGQTKSNIEALE
jgi:hypothetical protein